MVARGYKESEEDVRERGLDKWKWGESDAWKRKQYWVIKSSINNGGWTIKIQIKVNLIPF